MESFLYGVFWTEPVLIFLSILVRLLKIRIVDLEKIVSMLYMIGIIATSLFLLKRKSWTRKLILIQQFLRAVTLILFFVLGLLIFILSAVDQKTLRLGLGYTFMWFGIFLLPSLIVWPILMMRSIKEEFSSQTTK